MCPMSDSQRQRIQTYFSRNYVPGEQVLIPEISRLDSQEIRQDVAKGASEDWKDWMKRRLKDVGFYDEFGIREKSHDAPPRIFLRGDATTEEASKLAHDGTPFEGGSLLEGHYEFKVWLQHNVEKARNGAGSLRFLASARPGNEYEEYTSTFDRLSDRIEELFEREMDWEHIDGKHLQILRRLIGRADPDYGGKSYDPEWHSKRKTFDQKSGDDYRKYLNQLKEIRRMESRTCIVRKVCEATARSLISTSTTSVVSNEEIFLERCEKDPLGFVNWAQKLSVSITDDQVDGELEARFTRDGQFSEKYATRARKRTQNKLGMNDSEFREKIRLSLIVKNLVKAGIEPESDWKRVRISIPAIVLVRDLSNKIQSIVTSSRERLGEILNSCDEIVDYEGTSDYSLRDGVSKEDIFEGMESEKDEAIKLFKTGFGAKKGGGQTSKGPFESDTHNSRKLAYNVLIMLHNGGLLTNVPMTKDEYVAHFLGGDDTRLKPRGGKRWPNVFTFTARLLGWIGEKVNFEDFESDRENAIFRHLRHDRSKYMYCEPEQHRFDKDGELIEGGYLWDVQDGRITSRYQFKSEYEEFDSIVIVDDEEMREQHSRCHPDEATTNALNSLQSVQWEINLDLISRFFDLTTSNAALPSNIEGGSLASTFGTYTIPMQGGVIEKIDPKECFKGYFSENKEDREDVGLSLGWAARIINHNANVFWHPWYCDFRGRMYPRCANLSPIGDDLNKALIRFKHWKKMDERGFYWLQVHVHNLLCGVKGPWKQDIARRGESFDGRVAWVGKWEQEIRMMSRKPEEFRRELELDTHRQGKREALQRLAAMIEYDRLLTCFESKEVNGDWSKVYSGLPVHLDASCNGYQHISTLFRNADLAKTVNVISTGGDSQDVYELVADTAKEKHSKEVKGFLDEHLGESLSDIAFERIFDRRLAKKPTMIRAYGSTRFTKAMSGRSGQGASVRSKPQPREWTKSQRKEIEWLEEKHPAFINAREEFLEDPSLGKKHYERHAVKYKNRAELRAILERNGYRGKRAGAEPGKIMKSNATKYELREMVDRDPTIEEDSTALKWRNNSVGNAAIKSVAKSWMKLLKEEEEHQLWAEGSGLHWAILEHPELKGQFWYDPEDKGKSGPLWKEQPNLTRRSVRAYKQAIEEVCGVVYADFEEAFSTAVERSEGKYPGVRWRTSGSIEEMDSGFVVSNYYMKAQEGGSKAKWPTKRDSCYSGLNSLPYWYTQSKNSGGWESEVKTTDRIKEKLVRFLEKLDRPLPANLKKWELRGRGGMMEILEWIHVQGSDHEYLYDDIRSLLGHVSISVPFFSDNEGNRIDIEKISSSICPNFVHSLDACHMRTTINRMSEGYGDLSFWAVHDSFGTHPSRVDKLREVVISSFWDLHRGRDIDWWLEELQGPKNKIFAPGERKLVSEESSKKFKSAAEGVERSPYLIS